MNDTYFIIGTIGMIVLTIAIIVFLMLHRFRLNKLNRELANLELLSSLKEAFSNNLISSTTDLNDIIKGFPKFDKLYLKLPWDLLTLLQKLKFKFATSKERISEEQLEILNILIAIVKKEIEEENIKSPFENVPTIERNLLFDLLELSGQKENSVFREKLTTLGEQIITRQSTIDKLSIDSSKSYKTSKLSFILGIIFFLISLFLSIYSLSKN